MMRFKLAPQIGQTIKLSVDPASADLLSASVARLAYARKTPSIEIVLFSIHRRDNISYPVSSGSGDNSLYKRPE